MPYFLIASSIFLLITVAIYTWMHKLLNYYSRIMRHFAVSLFAAFIVLAIVKLTNKHDVGWGPCKALGMTAIFRLFEILPLFKSKYLISRITCILFEIHFLFQGYLVQYFFLVAFALMTTMCLELWITIRYHFVFNQCFVQHFRMIFSLFIKHAVLISYSFCN